MAASDCQQEVNSLPLLTGCPADTETILVMNSTAAGNVGGYGRRFIKDVRICFLNSLKFVFNQFRIGDAGAPIAAGATQLIVTQANVIQDSVFLTLGGPELPRDPIVDQVSYGVVYSSTGFTINFLQPVQNTELYILHYAYSS